MKWCLALACLLPALPSVLGTARTTPPSGAVVVRGSGTLSGEFSTISAAVASLSGTANRTIFIYPGTYNEQVNITYGGPLTIYGSTSDTGTYKDNTVTITHGLNAQDNGGNDACATLRAHSTYFRLYNVNVVNSYGAGKQATAVAARNPYQGYYGCQFTGYQDTLFADATGPQYYSNCLITGAVDYIYGAASAWFGECTLASVGGGAITANSRSTTTDTSYYVIDHSTITSGTSTSLTSDVYLGRPWREYARVVFQNSVLPNLINPIGWTTLADPAEPIFQEYGNTGAGADTSKRVDETALSAAISKTAVLGSSWQSWTDTTY